MRNSFLGFNIKERKATIFDGGDVPFSGSTLKQIGKGLVAMLSTPELVEESANKYVYITSFTVTQNELLRRFEKLTGDKWTVEHVKTDPIHQESTEKFKKGDRSAIGALIQTAVFSDEKLADFSDRAWDQKLGLPREDLDETLAALL
jgi:hypothetical protein